MKALKVFFLLIFFTLFFNATQIEVSDRECISKFPHSCNQNDLDWCPHESSNPESFYVRIIDCIENIAINFEIPTDIFSNKWPYLYNQSTKKAPEIRHAISKIKNMEDLNFTLEELLYIKNKKIITMCINPNWMPLEMNDQGKHIGISAEYMKLFEDYSVIFYLLLWQQNSKKNIWILHMVEKNF